jgi:gluconolactonase
MLTRRTVTARLGSMFAAPLAWQGMLSGAMQMNVEIDDETRIIANAAQIAAAIPRIMSEPERRTVQPVNMRIVAEGLRFPEGPVVLADGSVLVVEIAAGTISRCTSDGRIAVVARTGGGPNGIAIGPDGACYVANNGGFKWVRQVGGLMAPTGDLSAYTGGYIQRVDLDTGRVATLYDAADGHRLSSPNDLVFDRSGGFWFTDWGKPLARSVDKGGLYYAKADGSHIACAAYGLVTPNGVGLSPDGRKVYVSESRTGRLLVGDLDGPGRLSGNGLTLLAAPGGNTAFDSLKVEADGSICIATPVKGGITRITPDGMLIEHVPIADNHTTNLAFGGADMRTCFVTLSGLSRLVALDWPRPGLPLNGNR